MFIYLSINATTFSSEFKVVKLALLFKMGLKTKGKIYRPIYLLILIFIIKYNIIWLKMFCFIPINQVSE